jgi:hypothetical protein
MSRISCTPTKLLLQQRPLLSQPSWSLALRKQLITLPQPAHRPLNGKEKKKQRNPRPIRLGTKQTVSDGSSEQAK